MIQNPVHYPINEQVIEPWETYKWITHILLDLFKEGKITGAEFDSVLQDWHIKERRLRK